MIFYKLLLFSKYAMCNVHKKSDSPIVEVTLTT